MLVPTTLSIFFLLILLLLINVKEINGFQLIKCNAIRMKSIVLHNDNIIDIDVNNNEANNDSKNKPNDEIDNKKKDILDPETKELIMNLLNVGLVGYLLGVVLEIAWKVFKAKRAGLL